MGGTIHHHKGIYKITGKRKYQAIATLFIMIKFALCSITLKSARRVQGVWFSLTVDSCGVIRGLSIVSASRGISGMSPWVVVLGSPFRGGFWFCILVYLCRMDTAVRLDHVKMPVFNYFHLGFQQFHV